MSKPFYKHKLLFDENMPPRTGYPRLNEHFDVKHVSHDYHQDGADDEDVYQRACEQGRIIITINVMIFLCSSVQKMIVGLLPYRMDQLPLALIPNSLRFSCTTVPISSGDA